MSNISEFERTKPTKTYKLLKEFLKDKEEKLDVLKNHKDIRHMPEDVALDIVKIKEIINSLKKGE